MAIKHDGEWAIGDDRWCAETHWRLARGQLPAKARKKLVRRWVRRVGQVTGWRARKRPASSTGDLELYKPDWAELYAFPRVYEHMQASGRRVAAASRANAVVPASDVLGVLGVASMPQAHAIKVDQEQLLAIPPLSLTECAELLDRVRLPMDPLWLDFTRPPGRDRRHMAVIPAPKTSVTGDHTVGVALAGALLTRQLDDAAGLGSAEDLLVIPYGCALQIPAAATGAQDVVAGAPGSGDWWTPPIRRDGHHMPEFAPLGTLARVEEDPGVDVATVDQEEDGFQYAVTFVRASACGWPRKDTWISLGVPEEPAENEMAIDGWGRPFLVQLERVMAVLYLMDAEVDLVEAPIGRPARRQAQRRGLRVPLAIAAKRRVVRGGSSSGNGNGSRRQYSHRFQRISHYMHITKPLDRNGRPDHRVSCRHCEGAGRIEGERCERCNATGLDPDKVNTCVRRDPQTDQLTCPHGCKRIWLDLSETWIGPDEGPMVPKMRRLR